MLSHDEFVSLQMCESDCKDSKTTVGLNEIKCNRCIQLKSIVNLFRYSLRLLNQFFIGVCENPGEASKLRMGRARKSTQHNAAVTFLCFSRPNLQRRTVDEKHFMSRF